MPNLQVQTTAAEAKSAAVAQLRQHVEACQLKAVRHCEGALRAGWADGLPAAPQQWADGLLSKYEACKAEDSLASHAQDQVAHPLPWQIRAIVGRMCACYVHCLHNC